MRRRRARRAPREQAALWCHVSFKVDVDDVGEERERRLGVRLYSVLRTRHFEQLRLGLQTVETGFGVGGSASGCVTIHCKVANYDVHKKTRKQCIQAKRTQVEEEQKAMRGAVWRSNLADNHHRAPVLRQLTPSSSGGMVRPWPGREARPSTAGGHLCPWRRPLAG